MELQTFISSLHQYGENGIPEKKLSEKFIELLQNHAHDAFKNQNWWGHITGSFLIINPEKTKVLLMFHKKFQKWLQFGGHSDGNCDTRATAIREFHEESGIEMEPILLGGIFDIDIHDIPADLKWRPTHQHYDILYLGTIPEDTPFTRQESEVDDIRWFDIEWIWKYIAEERMLNMLKKIKTLPHA